MIRGLVSSALRAARSLWKRLGTRVVILGYHRVADLESDVIGARVSTRHFSEHLEILTRTYRVVGLQQVTRGLQEGRLGRRAVVLTFDDGYLDNLENARPLLERHAVPATLFAASGTLGSNREYWWDELDRLLLRPGTLPNRLDLRLNETAFEWELGAAADYTREAYDQHCHWNAMMSGEPGPRQRLYLALFHLIRSRSPDQREQVLAEVARWAGDGRVARPSHRVMTAEELVRMAEGGLVEVGAHTVTHPSLSALPWAAQREEIDNSKSSLEELLGRPMCAFAYPYGSRDDYTPDTVGLVREAGFACACANFPDVVRRHTDRFQLPRFVVRDWDGDTFARVLRGWFDG